VTRDRQACGKTINGRPSRILFSEIKDSMEDHLKTTMGRETCHALWIMSRKSGKTVDPIRAEVVARFLLATAEEMGATLTRTAFSPNIKERADCSTAIFDGEGEVIALAQRVPIHLGSMVGAVDEIIRRFGRDGIAPGDMFVANDPYNGGGTHLPDITIIAPVFAGKRIAAFVANIAHHADVGGMVPGSEARCANRFTRKGYGFRRCGSCAGAR
jgi:N-methylhydantoinase B/oxoprolinase/acetone carboxylase alpha subunit